MNPIYRICNRLPSQGLKGCKVRVAGRLFTTLQNTWLYTRSAYNAKGQLTQKQVGRLAPTTCAYDYMGRRFEKKVEQNGETALHERYLYRKTPDGCKGGWTCAKHAPRRGEATRRCRRINYRYYNPQDGRWTRRDPIGILGGENSYMYVCNNAVMITDLLGLLRSASEYIDMYGNFGESGMSYCQALGKFLNDLAHDDAATSLSTFAHLLGDPNDGSSLANEVAKGLARKLNEQTKQALNYTRQQWKEMRQCIS